MVHFDSTADTLTIQEKIEQTLQAYARNKSIRKTEKEVGLSRGRVWEITKQHAERLAQIRHDLAGAAQGPAAPPPSMSINPEATALKSKLTDSEKSEFVACESIIRRGLQTFFEVGQALQTIRDHWLYRENYDGFEDYCRERWGISKTHANRQIAAVGVVRRLDDKDARELTEWDIRPLTRLSQEALPSAWQLAKENAKAAHLAMSNQLLLAAASQVSPPKPKKQARRKISRQTSSAWDGLMRAAADAEAGIKSGRMADVEAAVRQIRAGLEKLALKWPRVRN